MTNSMRERESVAVRFGDVSIREYEVIPCDNPSVQEGAGIGLGWSYNVLHERKPIDEYEEERRKVRRSYYHLQWPPSSVNRHRKLIKFGFTDEEISEASMSCTRQRNKHNKSLARMRYDRFYELKEHISLACKRFYKRGPERKS